MFTKFGTHMAGKREEKIMLETEQDLCSPISITQFYTKIQINIGYEDTAVCPA
jgi:hypothetical protein